MLSVKRKRKRNRCHRGNIEELRVALKEIPRCIKNELNLAKNPPYYGKAIDCQCNMSNMYNLEAHAYAADIPDEPLRHG